MRVASGAPARRPGAAAVALAALAALAGCRRDAGAPVDAPAVAPPPPPRPPPTAPARAPPTAAPRWCAAALPVVDARAVDRRGHLVALAGTTLRDETAGGPGVQLAPADRCAAPRYHLQFLPDGRAVAVVHGRVFVRAGEAAPWVATPVCTDLQGEPVAPRAVRSGWAAVARRVPEREAALLLTEDPAGRVGWYALTALDAATDHVVLEGDGSVMALNDGHLIMIDRDRLVAGQITAAQHDRFASLTRTARGVVAARDVDERSREVVVGAGIQSSFELLRRSRPSGSRTWAVFAGNYDRLLAVTSRGVEVLASRQGDFVEVAPWPPRPSDAATPDVLGSVSLGWHPDGSPVIVSFWAAVSNNCAAIRGSLVGPVQ